MQRERNADGTFIATHGMRHTRLYRIWCLMKRRCNNPNTKEYADYGGKGIKVCKSWNDSFENFHKWAMSAGYTDDLSIDRLNNDKGYSPDNCRWATCAQQNRNYSRNFNIFYNGATKCLSDWADEVGINRATLRYRINAGKSLDEVFSKEDGRRTRWMTKQTTTSQNSTR